MLRRVICSITCLLAFQTALAPSAASAKTAEPVPVVVTISVLKDLVEQVGGPHVRVTSLLSGLENEHSYSPKPSDLVAVRKARLLVEVGLGLEVWVTALIKSAGNADLLVATTSTGIVPLRDDESEPAAGGHGTDDPHHAGNPHVWLDPDNAKVMVGHIAEALSRVDPAHAADYRANRAAYLRRVDEVTADLLGRVNALPSRRIVVHHPAWPYFARRFGFEIVGQVQGQSGAEPSARHLQRLIDRMRHEQVRVIVAEPQMNQKLPAMLARETGARVVVLTPLPGAVAGTATYLDMLRYNVAQLTQALGTP